MRSVGIIGGIGPESTVEYYRLIIAAYRERRRDGSAPPIIINSIDLWKMLALIAANQLVECDGGFGPTARRIARAGEGSNMVSTSSEQPA